MAITDFFKNLFSSKPSKDNMPLAKVQQTLEEIIKIISEINDIDPFNRMALMRFIIDMAMMGIIRQDDLEKLRDMLKEDPEFAKALIELMTEWSNQMLSKKGSPEHEDFYKDIREFFKRPAK